MKYIIYGLEDDRVNVMMVNWERVSRGFGEAISNSLKTVNQGV